MKGFIVGIVAGIVLVVGVLAYNGHIETKTHDETFTKQVTVFDGFDIK